MSGNFYTHIMIGGIMLFALVLSACDKVSPTGMLNASTGVDDRVEMSIAAYKEKYIDKLDFDLSDSIHKDYSVLIASDSHVWDDSCRLAEMFSIAYRKGDLLIPHLGDLADTNPEPYLLTLHTVQAWNEIWLADSTNRQHYYETNPIGMIPFFPVVGNHDLTHNGWGYFSNFFGTSTYVVNVYLDKEGTHDVHLFMDSASGTMGNNQISFLESVMASAQGGTSKIRNLYAYTHTNLFRGTSGNMELASTYPREEVYFLLSWFHNWNEKTLSHQSKVFCGHIHEYDEFDYGGVKYFNAESMSERNMPDSGPLLMRMHCNQDGTSSVERVQMYYTPGSYIVL